MRNALLSLGAMAVFGLAALPSGAQTVTRSPEVEKSGALQIASTLEYAPFAFIDENGNQVGVNIELAQAIADLMGAKLDVVRMPFPSMIPGLAAGRFHVAWETFTATEERLEQVDFVMFLRAGLVVSTPPEKVESFSGDTPLCGKTIGVITGTMADFHLDKLAAECAEKGQPALEKKVFLEAKDVLQAGLSGRIDGKLDDATAAGYYEVTSGGKMVVLPAVYEESLLGIAIPKGDTGTATMLAEGLDALMAGGQYKEIMEKYGLGTAMIDHAVIVDSIDDVQ